jgi:hypothetical protein
VSWFKGWLRDMGEFMDRSKRYRTKQIYIDVVRDPNKDYYVVTYPNKEVTLCTHDKFNELFEEIPENEVKEEKRAPKVRYEVYLFNNHDLLGINRFLFENKTHKPLFVIPYSMAQGVSIMFEVTE